jgi:hypothetical protein
MLKWCHNIIFGVRIGTISWYLMVSLYFFLDYTSVRWVASPSLHWGSQHLDSWLAHFTFLSAFFNNTNEWIHCKEEKTAHKGETLNMSNELNVASVLTQLQDKCPTKNNTKFFFSVFKLWLRF